MTSFIWISQKQHQLFTWFDDTADLRRTLDQSYMMYYCGNQPDFKLITICHLLDEHTQRTRTSWAIDMTSVMRIHATSIIYFN